jgi:hypothetical protein
MHWLLSEQKGSEHQITYCARVFPGTTLVALYRAFLPKPLAS